MDYLLISDTDYRFLLIAERFPPQNDCSSILRDFKVQNFANFSEIGQPQNRKPGKIRRCYKYQEDRGSGLAGKCEKLPTFQKP